MLKINEGVIENKSCQTCKYAKHGACNLDSGAVSYRKLMEYILHFRCKYLKNVRGWINARVVLRHSVPPLNKKTQVPIVGYLIVGFQYKCSVEAHGAPTLKKKMKKLPNEGKL